MPLLSIEDRGAELAAGQPGPSNQVAGDDLAGYQTEAAACWLALKDEA
jgi:hypothetical protein